MNTVALADTHTIWQVALGLGAVVALVVVVLMMLLLSLIKDIEGSVGTLLETAGVVAGQTANIPKLAAVPGVLNGIIDEAVVQDGYMDVLAEAFGLTGGPAT